MGNVKASVPVYKHHQGTLYPQELLTPPRQQIKRLYRLMEPKPHLLHPPGSLHQQGRHKHPPQKMNHTNSWVRINQITIENINQLVLHKSEQKDKNSTTEAPPHPGPSAGPSAAPRTNFTSRNLGTGRPTIQCTACGKYSHWRRECPYDNYCTTCKNHDNATHMCRACRQASNNQGQQGQTSLQICLYCGSIEHNSSNCQRRPWNNREQPHDTPEPLRRDQQANSHVSGRVAPMGANNGHNSRLS